MSAAEDEAPAPKAPEAGPPNKPVWAVTVRERISQARTVFAVLVALSTIALLVATTDKIGYARDEGFYFQSARRYAAWFELLGEDRGKALSRREVDAAFVVNHEHPALMKSAFGLSNLWLQKKRHLFDETGTSFRFPSIVLAGAMVGLVFAWAARRFGMAAGAVAGASLLFMPAVFFHAHLACFDVPIAAFFLFTFFAYDRSLQSGGAFWPVMTGVLFGLSLDTKHNSWFLPIAFTAHTVCLAFVAWRVRRPVRDEIRRSVQTLFAMALLGPVVFVAGWPWLWFDTWARFKDYASFHLNHEYYNMEFLGENYWTPPMPRTYAPLMTAATVPFVTLLAAAVAVGTSARSLFSDLKRRPAELDYERSTAILWAIGILVSYGAWTRSGTPIFGGTKHWMTAYPFIALFASQGVMKAASALRSEIELGRLHRAAGAALPVCVVTALAAPIYESATSHPWGVASYTPLVGGQSGAASLGLNRTFWGYTTGSLVDWLNAEVPQGGRVYPHDTAWASWIMLQEDGRLRKDIQAVWAADEADVVLYHHEMHMQGQEYQAWVALGTVQPAVVRGPDGVPVIWAYTRRSRKKDE